MARIPLLDYEDLPEEYADADLLSSFRPRDELAPEVRDVMAGDERNVYRALGHVPGALSEFREMGGVLWEQAGMSMRERELAVLTVARTTESHYEWHQHIRIGLSEGLSKEEIRDIREWDLEDFDAEERALMEYTAAVVDAEVDRGTHDAMAVHYETDEIVAVNLLVGMYLTIARAMSALDVEVEEPFFGWDLENLE